MSEKMTRDDIIRMAREQGLPETTNEGVFIVNTDDLGRMLAAEREAAIQAAVEAERSETAQLLRVDAGYVFEDECSGARDAVNYCVSLVEARRGKK